MITLGHATCCLRGIADGVGKSTARDKAGARLAARRPAAGGDRRQAARRGTVLAKQQTRSAQLYRRIFQPAAPGTTYAAVGGAPSLKAAKAAPFSSACAKVVQCKNRYVQQAPQLIHYVENLPRARPWAGLRSAGALNTRQHPPLRPPTMQPACSLRKAAQQNSDGTNRDGTQGPPRRRRHPRAASLLKARPSLKGTTWP